VALLFLRNFSDNGVDVVMSDFVVSAKEVRPSMLPVQETSNALLKEFTLN